MASPATRLTLPTEPAAADRAWINQRFVVIGQPGVGKSTLWSNGPRTLYIDTEGTIGHLAVKRMPARSLDEIREINDLLLEAQAKGDFPFDTIIFDTLDKVAEAIEAVVVAEASEKFKRVTIESVSDVPEGGGYSKVANKLMSLLDCWASLPAALVLITHPKQVKIKDPAGTDFEKETITLFPSSANRVLGWSHHNLHIQSRWSGSELKRVVRTRPERTIEAKSHGNIVKDKWAWETADLAKEYAELRLWFT